MPRPLLARELTLSTFNWDTADIRAILIDASDLTQAKNISAATNANPTVLTSTAHGFANGDEIFIIGASGNTAINGHFKVASQATNTFQLTDPYSGAAIAGNGTFSGAQCWAIPLSGTGLDYLNDVAAGARVATSAAAMTNTTVANGVFDADDVTFSSVAAGDAADLILLYNNTGTESTSALLDWISSASLPLTPNGNNISLAWDNGAAKIFAEVA